VPNTVEEAVELAEAGALCATRSITVRNGSGEEFARIVGHELGEKPFYREPGWDEEVDAPDAEPVAASDEEIPF
jgi:hypothetical protein